MIIKFIFGNKLNVVQPVASEINFIMQYTCIYAPVSSIHKLRVPACFLRITRQAQSMV